MPTLLIWSKTIKDDFVARNFAFAAESDVEKLGDGFRVDPRSLFPAVREIQGVMRMILRTNEQQSETIRDLYSQVRELREEARENNRLNSILISMLQRLIGANVTEMVNEDANDVEVVEVEHTRVLRFPQSLRGLTMPQAMVDFYVKGWYAAYQPGWRAPEGEIIPPKGVKKTIRACVEFASMFLSEPIPPLPTGARNAASPEATEWRAMVVSASQSAWDEATTFLERHDVSQSESCSAFEKNMKSIGPEAWPVRPNPGDDSFGVVRPAEQLQAEFAKHRSRKRAREEV